MHITKRKNLDYFYNEIIAQQINPTITPQKNPFLTLSYAAEDIVKTKGKNCKMKNMDIRI